MGFTVSSPVVWRNSYILSIDSRMERNQSPSSLNLTVVDVPEEDFDVAQSVTRDVPNAPEPGYSSPGIGKYVEFNLPESRFDFQGIVVSEEIPKKTDSAATKSVTINDTREVLNQIPVIVGYMARLVSMPQAINAFRWWDVFWPLVGVVNVSDSNEFGMPWNKILDAIKQRPVNTDDTLGRAVPQFVDSETTSIGMGLYTNILGRCRPNEKDEDVDNNCFEFTDDIGDSVNRADTRYETEMPVHATRITPDPPVYKSLDTFGRTMRMEFTTIARASGDLIHLETGNIVDALNNQSSGTESLKQFQFFGEKYRIDLTNLPNLDNFRIKGDIIYLGDLIDKAATFGQFDWYVDKTETKTIDGVVVRDIIVKTIDRKNALPIDEQAVQDWVDSKSDSGGSLVISHNQSRELRNERTMLLLFGGNLEQLTRKSISGQWYGMHKSQQAIFQDTVIATPGQLMKPRTVAGVDLQHLNFSFLQREYNFDEIALRAALYGPEINESFWTYLFHINHPLVVDMKRGANDQALEMMYNFSSDEQKGYLEQYNAAARDSLAFRKNFSGNAGNGDRMTEAFNSIGKAVQDVAEKYWGKQFVVKSPTGLLLNWDIVDSAFQGFAYNEATAFFRDKDGVKVHGYVVFPRVNPFWIKTDLQDTEIYLFTNESTGFTDLYVSAEFELVDNTYLIAKISEPVEVVPGGSPRQSDLLAQWVGRGLFLSQDQQIFNGSHDLGLEHQCIYPTWAYVPLRSKNETYGPWISQGLEILSTDTTKVEGDGNSIITTSHTYGIKDGYDGKLEIIKDDELTPWFLGGTAVEPFFGMNRAANAIVDNASSNLVRPITLTIKVEGLPEFRLGEIISAGIQSNANISDINIRWGEDGITTTYIVKNYAAKPREFTTADFKMGSALQFSTTKISADLPVIGRIMRGVNASRKLTAKSLAAGRDKRKNKRQSTFRDIHATRRLARSNKDRSFSVSTGPLSVPSLVTVENWYRTGAINEGAKEHAATMINPISNDIPMIQEEGKEIIEGNLK